MFDCRRILESADDATVVSVMARAARAQNALCARELSAIGELYARRAPMNDAARQNWAIDGHENVVSEVSAALGISRGRARGRLRYAIALRERLPRIAEAFACGAIDFRMMAAVVHRTELVEDAKLIAKLDAVVARHAPNWTRLSEPKLYERIDMWVMRLDPAGTRVPRRRQDDRTFKSAPSIQGLQQCGLSCMRWTGRHWIASWMHWPTRCVRRIRERRHSAGRTL
jgi:hypothetical protein